MEVQLDAPLFPNPAGGRSRTFCKELAVKKLKIDVTAGVRAILSG
jgi:hypothetical protein